MIFGGLEAYQSRRSQKLMTQEINATVSAREAIPTFSKWSETAMTFNRTDHPDHIRQSGHFPLIIDPIIGKTRLTKVLMDGGSGLNLLYIETYDAMGLS